MGFGGIAVRLSGMADAQTATDQNGQYAFTGLRAGTYSVEISGFDTNEVGFSSTSSSATVGVGESKVVSFDGTYLRTAGIMGQVSVEGMGLAGVTVTLAGEGEDASTMTDAGGLYAFSKLKGGDYSVAISGYDPDDYEFTTTAMNVSVATGETANVPFEGTLLRTAGISGRVSVDGMGIPGVTVTLAGAAEATADTDDSGQYAFAGLAEGTYVVSMSNPDEVAYSFDETMATVELGDSEAAIRNFEGTHTRTASVSGVMFLDEDPNDGMYTANEPHFEHAGIPVILQGPGVTDVTVSVTDTMGAFMFPELRAGTYRVLVDVNEEVSAALAEGGFSFGGDATGEVVMVAAGGEGHVAFPFHIEMQTVISGARMGGGGVYGLPVEGVELALYARADMTDMLDTATTDAMGVAKFDFARADNTGPAGNDNIVFVAVKSTGEDNEVLVPSGNEFTEIAYAGTARAYQADHEKEVVTLVNIQANFQFWIKSDKDARSGDMGLGGWLSEVRMGKDTLPLMMMDEDGDTVNLTMPTDTAMGANLGKATATYMVDPTMLPAVFTIMAAAGENEDEDEDEDEDEEDPQAMAMGEKWEQSDALMHTHTGLELPAANTHEMNDQGPIYITFTTQTLTVGVYRETDDVPGMSDFRSGVQGGDARPDSAVAKEMRARVMVNAAGRRGFEIYDEWDHDDNPKTPDRDASLAFTGGQVSFGNLPADMDFTVEFDPGADRVAVGGPDSRGDRVETFGDDVELGHSVGAFGDGSGAGPEVRLCPLSVDDDPMDDEDPMCATFGYQWATGTITGSVGTVKDAVVSFVAETDEHSEPPRDVKTDKDGEFSVSGVQDGEYEVTTPDVKGKYKIKQKDNTITISIYHDETEDDEDEDTDYIGTAASDAADFGTTLRGLSIRGFAANISHENNQVVRGDETYEDAVLELWAYNAKSKSKTTKTKGTVLDTATVQADGSYEFDELDAGMYVIIAKNTDDYEMLRTGPDVHYAQPVPASTYADVDDEDLKLPYWDYEASAGVQLSSTHTVVEKADTVGPFTFYNFALLHGDGEFSGRVIEARDEPSGIAVELRRCETTDLDADGDAVDCKEEVDFDAENASADKKGRWEFPGLREGYYVANIAATTYNRAKWGDDGIDDDAANCEGGSVADADCDDDRTEDAYGMLEGSRAFNRGGANFYVYNRTLEDDDDMDGVDAEGTIDPDEDEEALTDGDIDDAITFASESITVEPDGIDDDASFEVTTGKGKTMKSWPISTKGVATVELGYNKTGSTDEGDPAKGTEITVTVTAENGYNDTDHTFTYYRSNPVGNTLIARDFSVEAPTGTSIVEDFGKVDAFTVNVAEAVDDFTFTVTLEDTETQGLAVMMGGDTVDAADRKRNDGAHEMRYELELASGANTIDLAVTSEDEVEREYQLVVRRGMPPPPPSADATLSALTLSGVEELDPVFDPATGTYTAEVAHSVATTTVTATETENGANSVISPDDADATTSGHQVELDAGEETVITVTVTAANGVATMEYEVTVTRAAAPPTTSTDATLSTLELSGVTLDPAFDPATETYTAEVANTITSTTVTATTANTGATADIDPGEEVELEVGKTVITVTVTAADRATEKEYTVTVTRLASTTPAVDISETVLNLVEQGDAGTYTVGLAIEPTKFPVTVTISGHVDPATDVRINGQEAAADVVLRFTSTDWDAPRTVSVTVVEDTDFDDEDDVTLTHTVAGGNYDDVEVDDVTVKSTDNDVENAGVTVSTTTVTVEEGGDDMEYTIVLDVAPKGPVTVTATVPDDAEFTVSPSSLTFTVANFDDAQTFTVTALDDDNAADADAEMVEHEAKGGGYDDEEIADVAVTVTDDDETGVMVSAIAIEITEGSSARYTVRLASEPTGEPVLVTVAVTGTDSDDVYTTPSVVSFTQDSWDRPQNVTVHVRHDTEEEGTDETNGVATLGHTAAGGVVVPVSWTRGRLKHQAALRLNFSRARAGVVYPCRWRSQPLL